MPMYEFLCKECGHKFVELVFSSRSSLEDITCPKCGVPHPKKLISAAVFTGSTCSSDMDCPSPSSSGFG